MRQARPAWMAPERPNRPRTNPAQIVAKKVQGRRGYATVRGEESNSRAARRNTKEQTRNQRTGPYNVPFNPFLLPIHTLPRKNAPAQNTQNAVLVSLVPVLKPPPPAPASRRRPPTRNRKPNSGPSNLNMLTEELNNLQLLGAVLNAVNRGKAPSSRKQSPRRLPANLFYNPYP